MSFLLVLDLTGVAVFAISGALAGVHRGLDLFGIAVVAAVTAIGGGTLRDLVLHRHPAFWVNDPRYLYVILAATVAAVVGEGYLPSLESGLLVADAIGLGLFALSGAQIAEGERRSWIVIVLMGTMTGVAGGVIRDLLSGVIPVLLRRDIYASAAIAGIVLYLLLQSAGVPAPMGFHHWRPVHSDTAFACKSSELAIAGDFALPLVTGMAICGIGGAICSM